MCQDRPGKDNAAPYVADWVAPLVRPSFKKCQLDVCFVLSTVTGIELCEGPDRISAPRDVRTSQEAIVSSSGISQPWVGILTPGDTTAGPCVALGHCFLICTIGTARNCLIGQVCGLQGA